MSLHSELEMILSLAESSPGLFNMTANRPEVAKQLEKIGRLKELLETNQEDLKGKQRDDWLIWMNKYRQGEFENLLVSLFFSV